MSEAARYPERFQPDYDMHKDAQEIRQTVHLKELERQELERYEQETPDTYLV